MKARFISFFLVFLLLGLAVSASEVSGRVLGPDDVPLPGVSLTLRSPAGESFVLGTDENGLFRFTRLSPGPYRLLAEIPGFDSYLLENLEVSGESGTPLTIMLVVHRIGSGPVGNIPNQAVPENGWQELLQRSSPPEPAATRDAGTAHTSVGITEGPAGDDSGSIPGEVFIINGSVNYGRQFSVAESAPENLFNEKPKAADTLGGMESMGAEVSASRAAAAKGLPNGGKARAKRLPSLTAKAAVARGKRAFSSKSGRGAGRPQGQLYYTLRHSALDARPYSLTGIENPKPAYAQSRFGFTLGGPLRLDSQRKSGRPWVYLFNYSGQRGRQGLNSTATVPLPEERQGDFSHSLLRSGTPLRVFDPLTASPSAFPRSSFPDNRIPLERLDPAALALLRFIPLPNRPGTVQNYYTQRSMPMANDQFSTKLVGRIAGNFGFHLNYAYNRQESQQIGVFPELNSTRSGRTHNLSLGLNRNLKTGLVHQFQLRINRSSNLTANPFSFQENILKQLDLQGLSEDPLQYGPPNIFFTNYGDLQLTNPSFRRQWFWEISDHQNIIHGQRTHRLGLEVRRTNADWELEQNGRGIFHFTGFATSNFDAQGNPLRATGSDFADFLLGLPQYTSRRFGGNRVLLSSTLLSAFYVHEWRPSANWTFNLGMRYEYLTAPVEKMDRLANVDLAPDLKGAAVVLPGTVGPFSGYFRRSLVDPDRNNLSPRIGIAYRPGGNPRWVVRAGYGIFYNLSIYEQIYPKLAGQPPFAVSQTQWASDQNPLTLHHGFPEDPSVTVRNTYAVDRHYRVGYVQNWNLTVEQELHRGLVLETSYAGAKGTRLDMLRAPNRAPAGSSPLTEAQRRIAGAEAFLYETSGASSIFHSLHLRLNRRLSRGFTFLGDYAFGKSIDNASSIGGGAQLVAQNDDNLRAERGPSSFDVRHRFTFQGSWELPLGSGRRYLGASSWRSRLLGSWTLSSTASLESGTPFTARLLGNTANNSGTGGNLSERASATGEPVRLPGNLRTQQQFFNTAAFTVPPPGEFGNAGRNSIPGPSFMVFNLNVRKEFRLAERNRWLAMNWQINNLFNHSSYRGLGTVLNAGNFGRVTSMRPMRSMEVTLRFRF